MPDTPSEKYPFERYPVYNPAGMTPNEDPQAEFRRESSNTEFKPSLMTYLSLLILLLLYPGMSLLGVGEDPTEMFKKLNQEMLMFVLIVTVIVQWVIYGVNYAAVYLEGTGLKGIGIKKLRLVHLAWAFAFLLAANLILAGLAWLLAQVGLPMPGEIGLLIPKDLTGKIIWGFVALTAGFCEEVAFRGYLMTRIRLMGKFTNWVVPTIISAVVFGICHAYQGWPGFIVITTYGAMFSLLYIRTGSLWPCIIAHFFQDFGALFYPQ